MQPKPMRVLRFTCAIAVLFTTLAYGHLVQHFYSHAAREGLGLGVVAALLLAVAVGVLSLIGGLLLLQRAR